jgi:hypothetical protein
MGIGRCPEHDLKIRPSVAGKASSLNALCRCTTKFRQVRQTDIERDSMRAVAFFQSVHDTFQAGSGSRRGCAWWHRPALIIV